MTEELLNVLAKVPGLRVPGRSSCFAFKGKNEENIFRKVGEQLHVSTVLEGSVRKAGEKVRITTQLINVADGFHLWSETYDREMKDILSVQTEVAQRVVQALELKLGMEDARALAKAPTESAEAYRLYLIGRHYIVMNEEQDARKASEYFKQALEKDPNYALAYAGLADCWNWKLLPREIFPRQRAYAETALRLDPQLAEAYYSMGWILMMGDWDFAGAEKAFQQSVKLNPNLTLGHNGYGWCLMFLARSREAEAEQKRAAELEPLSAFPTSDLGMVYEYAREFDKAIETAKRAIEVDPHYCWAYSVLGWSLLHQGKAGKAIPQFEKARSLFEDPTIIDSLGCAYAAAGNKAKAEEILKELDDLAARQYVSPVCQGSVLLFLGDKERCLKQLELCVDQRDPFCVVFKTDPAFDSLRGEPRFQALVKRVFRE